MNYAKSQEDLYAALEVSPNASEEVICAAFKALKVKCHPDRNDGDDRRFKEIGEAFDVLTNPAARARYQNARHKLKEEKIKK